MVCCIFDLFKLHQTIYILTNAIKTKQKSDMQNNEMSQRKHYPMQQSQKIKVKTKP